MCMKCNDGYAQIVLNMQRLTHLYIRDANARACLVTPPPLGHNPGGHTMGSWPKNHNKTSEDQKIRKCGLRPTPRGKRMGLRHYGIFWVNLRRR